MKIVVGNEKQEKKITEMGEIAHAMFGDISVMQFKGAFRRAISEALKKHGVDNWDDISRGSVTERKRFFDDFLENSSRTLEILGIINDQQKELFARLRQNNNKYTG